MEYTIKKVSNVIWILAVLSLIYSFILFLDTLHLLGHYTFEEYVILYLVIAIPCLFIGIALTLTLVSKALREITISTMNMLDEQKKNSK